MVEKEREPTPIGVITEVHGPVAVIACEMLPPLRQALCASFNHETYLFEVHQHLDERHVRTITLHRSTGLHRGMTVYDTGAPLHVPVAPECLGRLLNIFGEPLDDRDILSPQAFRNNREGYDRFEFCRYIPSEQVLDHSKDPTTDRCPSRKQWVWVSCCRRVSR